MPTKRVTNRILSSAVLGVAKKRNIDVSLVFDNYLCKFARREQERRWREEHLAFVTAYNSVLEAEDLPLQSL
jgi:post-segregation antitoxin (ccd killing protein)